MYTRLGIVLNLIVGKDLGHVAVLVRVDCELGEDENVEEDCECRAGDPASVRNEIFAIKGDEEDGGNVCDVFR